MQFYHQLNTLKGLRAHNYTLLTQADISEIIHSLRLSKLRRSHCLADLAPHAAPRYTSFSVQNATQANRIARSR